MSSQATASYWAVIPAAGAGKRMGSDIPKQYLPLHGRSVLEWALQPFLVDPHCRRIVVAIATDDAHWSDLALSHPKLIVTQGGVERADSVLAGLNALLAHAQADTNDWVLVHDAARPCLHDDDLTALLEAATADETVGALLATPLADTLKQADADLRIERTVPRAGLWRALTPQMFRIGLLREALQHARQQGVTVTDEASAVEALGLQPRLVAGRADNLKLTVPEDFALAASVLAARQLSRP